MVTFINNILILFVNSEDESPEVQQTPSSSSSGKSNRTQNSTTSSAVASSTCRSNIVNNSSSSSINSNIVNNNTASHHHTGVINSASSHSLNSNSSNNANSNRQRKNVISCFTVGDSDGEDRRSPRQQQQATNIKYEPHVGQSQKKRLLAMAQNECLLSSSSSSNQLHVPKQEPNEFAYEYPAPFDKRASWAPPAHHKRESISYLTAQPAPPPMAHAKNNAAASWGAPIYRQQHQSNTPLGGSPGGVLQHDIYAQGDMYRRPTVFVSQAPYQNYDRVVVPPPAHNGSSRQVHILSLYS